MVSLFDTFREAHSRGDGYSLATTFTPTSSPSNPHQLSEFVRGTSAQEIQTDARYALIYNPDISLPRPEANAWIEVFVAYWRAASVILTADEAALHGNTKNANSVEAYDRWKEVNNALMNGYSKGHFAAWTVPCLYVSGRYLRILAIRADQHATDSKGATKLNVGLQDDITDAMGTNDRLEDAARQINRIFSLCISDRAPIEDSRKWGLYYITNLLFKTYFKLNSISLSKNILRSLKASATDMPALSAFPKSHIVTFEYYVGVIHFLEEDFVQAEEHLTKAYQICHKEAHKNRALILTYLIPCRLMTSHLLPTSKLLSPYPCLSALFAPLGACIRRGDLAGFDAALAAGQDEFVKRRIYLTLERGRDIALRNLFRRVFLAGGFEEEPPEGAHDGGVRKTRVPVTEFMAGMRVGLAGDDGAVKNGAFDGVDYEEVECLIANMIYKNLMKGYISREHGKVVLSKAGAFPGTGV